MVYVCMVAYCLGHCAHTKQSFLSNIRTHMQRTCESPSVRHKLCVYVCAFQSERLHTFCSEVWDRWEWSVHTSWVDCIDHSAPVLRNFVEKNCFSQILFLQMESAGYVYSCTGFYHQCAPSRRRNKLFSWLRKNRRNRVKKVKRQSLSKSTEAVFMCVNLLIVKCENTFFNWKPNKLPVQVCIFIDLVENKQNNEKKSIFLVWH